MWTRSKDPALPGTNAPVLVSLRPGRKHREGGALKSWGWGWKGKVADQGCCRVQGVGLSQRHRFPAQLRPRRCRCTTKSWEDHPWEALGGWAGRLFEIRHWTRAAPAHIRPCP